MAKNLMGKTRKVNQPYQVYMVGDWEHRVLKRYQSTENERKNQHARAMCAVKSPYTYGSYDMGDTYLSQFQHGELVYSQPDGSPPVLKAGYKLETW